MQSKLTDFLKHCSSKIQELPKTYQKPDFLWSATWVNTRNKFSNLMILLKKIADFGFLRITPAEFIIYSLDSSEISFIELFLPKKAWSRYNCSKEVIFALNIKEFYKELIQFNRSKDLIHFTITDSEIVTCKVRNYSFQMRNLNNFNETPPSIPLIKYPVEFMLRNPLLFKELINNIDDELVRINFKFRNQEPWIEFNTKSSHINSSLNKNIDFQCYTVDDFELKFKRDYLQIFFNSLIPGTYFIEIGKGMPLSLTIVLDKFGGKSDYEGLSSYIRLYLALWSDS